MGKGIIFMGDKLKLYGFNNLTKALSFNIYDVCYAKTAREQKDYIAYIDSQYNSERLTNILTTLTDMIGAKVLNISCQDYEPQGASVTILIAEGSMIPAGSPHSQKRNQKHSNGKQCSCSSFFHIFSFPPEVQISGKFFRHAPNRLSAPAICRVSITLNIIQEAICSGKAMHISFWYIRCRSVASLNGSRTFITDQPAQLLRACRQFFSKTY